MYGGLWMRTNGLSDDALQLGLHGQVPVSSTVVECSMHPVAPLAPAIREGSACHDRPIEALYLSAIEGRIDPVFKLSLAHAAHLREGHLPRRQKPVCLGFDESA